MSMVARHIEMAVKRQSTARGVEDLLRLRIGVHGLAETGGKEQCWVKIITDDAKAKLTGAVNHVIFMPLIEYFNIYNVQPGGSQVITRGNDV
ncbi:hypothetical protein Tco_1012352 [Tanacetum coccineum]